MTVPAARYFALLLLQGVVSLTPPNILFLLSDDLGYGELSAFGQRNFSTPNIDRLAAEGMQFTNAYTGAPVCAPSRTVLMTGLHAGHAYIRGNNANPDGTDMALRANDTTVAQLLQSAGCACPPWPCLFTPPSLPASLPACLPA